MKRAAIGGMTIGGMILGFMAATPAAAHAPLLDCGPSGANMITCEAGYSDGSSAANQVIRVRDGEHRLVFEDRFDQNGSYNFTRPEGEFHIQFEGDQFHSIIVYITE